MARHSYLYSDNFTYFILAQRTVISQTFITVIAAFAFFLKQEVEGTQWKSYE